MSSCSNKWLIVLITITLVNILYIYTKNPQEIMSIASVGRPIEADTLSQQIQRNRLIETDDDVDPYISKHDKALALEKYKQQKGELIHFHVRKAAGTTVDEWFKRFINKNPNNNNTLKTFEGYNHWNEKLKASSDSIPQNIITREMKNKSDSALFAMEFRHPIDRILSHYEFEFRWGCAACCHTNSEMPQHLNIDKDPNDTYPNLNVKNYLSHKFTPDQEWYLPGHDAKCRKVYNTSKTKLCNIDIEDLLMRIWHFEMENGQNALIMKNTVGRGQIHGGYLNNYYLYLFCCDNLYCNIYKDFILTGKIQQCFDDAVHKIKSMDIVLISEWLNDYRTNVYVNKILSLDENNSNNSNQTINWVKFRPYPHKDNNRGRNHMVSKKVDKLLKEWNEWDLKLYQTVKEIVYERVFAL